MKRGRNWSYALASKHGKKPEATRDKEGAAPSALEEVWPAGTLALDLQAPELSSNKFLLL